MLEGHGVCGGGGGLEAFDAGDVVEVAADVLPLSADNVWLVGV